MVNEAKLIVETGLSLPMTVANDAGIEKGALLVAVDPNTASGAGVVENLPAAGVAISEKISGNGKIRLGVLKEGVVRTTASGATIGVGDPCFIKQDNTVGSLVTELGSTVSGAYAIGDALESAADGETFLMQLNIRRAR